MRNAIIELSDNKNKVMIDILFKISESEEWYSMKSISESINLSERSIQRYVNQLYDVVVNYNEEHNYFSLLLKKNLGVKLLIKDQANIDSLVTYILQEDENIKFALDLMFENYSTIDEYIKKKI